MSEIDKNNKEFQVAEHSQSPHQNNQADSDNPHVPPNLLRINADNNNKQTMIIYWLLFFSMLVLMAFVSLAVPPALLIQNNDNQLGSNYQDCNPIVNPGNSTLICDNISNLNPTLGLVIRNVVKLNQFALIMVQFDVIDNTQPFQISENLTLSYYSLTSLNAVNNTYDLAIQSNLYSGILYFSLSSNGALQVINQDGTLIGYQGYVGYFRDIEQHNYLITVTFTNQSQLNPIQQVSLTATLVNPPFTIFTIVIRICFFVTSLVCCILYWIRYRKIPQNQRIIQQKLIAYLSILLVMFNDPLYAATFLAPNGFLSFYSVFVVVNFLIFLLYHWVVFFERIHYENGQKETQLLDWRKYIYFGILYILTITLYCLFLYYHLQSIPIIPAYDLSTAQFVVLQIIIVILMLLVFVYIISLYIRIICSINQKLWRNQLFMYFSIFFMVVVIAEILYDGFQIFSYAGRLILLLFCSMNMYVYYMQYMYTITQQQIAKIQGGNLYLDGHQQGVTIMSDMDFANVDVNFKQEIRLPYANFNNNKNQIIKPADSQDQKDYQYQKVDDKKFQLQFNQQEDQKKSDFDFE